MLGEVGVVEQRVLGRVERRAQPLLVDLAVAGHTDREQLPVAAGLTDLEHHVLQRVGGGDLAVQSAVLAQSTSVAIVGVSRVSYTLASGCPSIGGDSGTAVITASTLAAYPDSRHRTKVSSPISLSARNSSDALPPIAPDTADTMT